MSNSLNNIRFSYLYRDSGNYKLYGDVIFSNQEAVLVVDIESQIRKCLIDGEHFDPIEWDIVPLRFEVYDDELDHDWHEFEKVEETQEAGCCPKSS
jgi:hypothetical protein